MMDKHYKDVPFAEFCRQAEVHMRQGRWVLQKFTCEHCGARQTFETPNQFYMAGQCEECNRFTNILECGYAIVTFPVKDDDDEVSAEGMK